MRRHHRSQQGLALPTVMAMLMLASVGTVLAWRQLWVNEILLKTEADQLRTQHKAEAVLPLAVQDIVGSASAASGVNAPNVPLSPLAPTPPTSSLSMNTRYVAGDSTQTHVFFPTNLAERDLLRQRLGSDACRSGICAVTPPKVEKNDLLSRASTWKSMTASAMPVSASDTPYGAGTAWYWVDIQPDTAQLSSAASASSAPPFIYRITVLATGVLPSSSTVLQTLWARTNLSDAHGHRHSWRILQD
jgi:Tfp pilus assembly protein PilX